MEGVSSQPYTDHVLVRLGDVLKRAQRRREYVSSVLLSLVCLI